MSNNNHQLGFTLYQIPNCPKIVSNFMKTTWYIWSLISIGLKQKLAISAVSLGIYHKLRTDNLYLMYDRTCTFIHLKTIELEEYHEEHVKRKLFKCEICIKEFYLDWRLRKHMNIHVETPRYCESIWEYRMYFSPSWLGSSWMYSVRRCGHYKWKWVGSIIPAYGKSMPHL